ncbi:MAG: DNA mismatch repair endonuclease MutL [Bdellovibrionales bacterium]
MSVEVLASEVVDQIAAGEVLDRPANLVKELIENSLDSGATEIEIEFSDGGRSVTVRDDGCGMNAEDLSHCLKRHATSKIRQAEDLFRLHTFGFRGEALASIAAVAEVRIASRVAGEKGMGHQLVANFGQWEPVVPTSTRVGTEIQVRELFANVPARLRFLKSNAAENTQIKTTLKALALAHPKVSFRIRSQGELLNHWPAKESLYDRARDVLSGISLYPAHHTTDGIRVEILAGSPRETTGANRNFWIFVQDRWVQDRTIVAAIMDAYRNLLMQGEYPTAVVKISMATTEVDVNVHPTKSQVKFQNPQMVFRAVNGVFREALEQAPWLIAKSSKTTSPSPTMEPQRLANETPMPMSFAGAEFTQVQYSKKAFPLADVREAVESRVAPLETSRPSGLPFSWADLQIVGQVGLTYIAAQSRDGFYLVDQHAAHERVVFERLMAGFKSGQVEVQNLLLPVVLDLNEAEVETLMQMAEGLRSIGLEVEPMGPESVAIRSQPALVTETAVVEGLRALVRKQFENHGGSLAETLVGDLLATMACHSVVRAGQALSSGQMVELLQQMDEFPLSSFCPHGRPVYVLRSFSEIEREFGRIV